MKFQLLVIKKIDSSFKLGVDIGADLDEISNLSSDANKANDKSYQLLDQMIHSLLEIDKK